VWPDVTVTEDSIARCVREVGRAIGDSEGRIVRTIAKRGYCLDIEVQSDVRAAASAPEHKRSVPIAEAGRRWSSCHPRAFPSIHRGKTLDRLTVLRGPGITYSDVILRLAGEPTAREAGCP
jgi:hypothetical protein